MNLSHLLCRKDRILCVLITLLFLVISQIFLLKFSYNWHHTSTPKHSEKLQKSTRSKVKVTFGIAFCGKRESKEWNQYIGQASVLFKSVLISAEIYNVSEIHFHLFLENLEEDEQTFRNLFKDMGYLTRGKEEDDSLLTKGQRNVGVTLYTYSIKSVNIPKQFKPHMIYHKRYRCAYVRFYFPSALPNVDSIIHMDVDAVITGSLLEIWSQIGKMNSIQMVGSVNTMAPENDKFPNTHMWNVREIPSLTKHGYNAGIIWMNLTRMRAFGWEERISRVYQDYSKFVKDISSQRVYNVLAYFSSDRTLTIPCQFNFGATACKKGFFCKDAESDPFGIQIVHGFSKTFLPGQTFHEVYQRFQDFSFTRTNFSVDLFEEQVMKPLRFFYEEFNPNVNGSTNSIGKCIAILMSINPCVKNVPKDELPAFKDEYLRLITTVMNAPANAQSIQAPLQLIYGVLEKPEE